MSELLQKIRAFTTYYGNYWNRKGGERSGHNFDYILEWENSGIWNFQTIGQGLRLPMN